MNLHRKMAEVFAGDGHEELTDGELLQASLAQPTALTKDHQNNIYFIDSESSAVRKISGNKISTLLGQGLFHYGDKDGKLKEAALQHPSGIYFHDNTLYIADTYNNKIKIIRLAEQIIETVPLAIKDIPEALNEPNDVKMLRGKMYIADTNHHRILVSDGNTTFTFI